MIVAAGGGLLGAAAWAWAGRSPGARWWVGRRLATQLMLAVVPGLGLILVGVGGLALVGTGVALLVAPPVLLGLVLELAGIFALLPRWWGPRWYRRRPAGEGGRRRL